MPTQVDAARLRTEQHDGYAQSDCRRAPDPGFTMKHDKHRPQVPTHLEHEVTIGSETEQRKEPKRMKACRPGNHRRSQNYLSNRTPVAIGNQPTQR